MATTSRASTVVHPEVADINALDLTAAHGSPLVSIQFGNAAVLLIRDAAVLDALREATTRAYDMLGAKAAQA
jgi:hypothetical protein